MDWRDSVVQGGLFAFTIMDEESLHFCLKEECTSGSWLVIVSYGFIVLSAFGPRLPYGQIVPLSV